MAQRAEKAMAEMGLHIADNALKKAVAAYKEQQLTRSERFEIWLIYEDGAATIMVLILGLLLGAQLAK